MSVNAYEAKFRALSRYATQLCFSPQERIRRFVKGLRSELRISAQEVVDFVIEVEGVKPDDFTPTSTSKRFRREVSLMVLTLEDRVREVTQSDQFSLHYRL